MRSASRLAVLALLAVFALACLGPAPAAPPADPPAVPTTMTLDGFRAYLDTHKIVYSEVGRLEFNPPLSFFRDAPAGSRYLVVPGGGVDGLQFGYCFRPDGSFREYGVWQ